MTFSATDGSGYPKRKVAVGGTSLERVQFEAEEAVLVHTEEVDPHPVYTTAAENNLVYSKLPHTHGPIPIDSEPVEDPLIPQPANTFMQSPIITGKLGINRSATYPLDVTGANAVLARFRSTATSAWFQMEQGAPPDAQWLFGVATDNASTNEFGIRDQGLGLTRLLFDSDGKMWINYGAGADTNLYRSAADTLKTDDVFEAAVRVQSPSFQTTNVLVQNAEEQSGGLVRLYKASATLAVPGDANLLKMYVRPGTNANTLKLVVIAGTAGTETTILDNIST